MKIKFIPYGSSKVSRPQIVASGRVLRFFASTPQISKEMRGRVILGECFRVDGAPIAAFVHRSLRFSREDNCWKQGHEALVSNDSAVDLKKRRAVWAIKE